MSVKSESGKNYGTLIKILQIISFLFMFAMVIVCVIFLKKYNISPTNVDALTGYLTGGTLTIALILTGFSIIKSFALIFPPAVLFVLSGIVLENFWTAVFVNFIATACSLILPYFLGRFTGADMVNSLKGRFKAIKKLDDFADENSFAVVLFLKPADLCLQI